MSWDGINPVQMFKVGCATNLEHLCRIYSIPTHDKHQWLLLVYSAPDDGREGRPKRVEHTCSC